MKIAEVRLRKLTGRADAGWLRHEARVAAPLDVYEEFRLRGPENQPAAEGAARIEATYVEIAADTGLIGRYGPIFDEQAFIIARRHRPFLLGRDPLAVEKLWDQMVRLERHGRAGYMMMATSAVDCALWDLRGKHLGAPVAQLLGGPTRTCIPAYASALGYPVEPEQAAAVAEELAGRGFAAQKWFFRHGPASGPTGRRANLGLARALRQAVGPDVDLMFDCWMSWTVPYAAEMARQLEAVQPTWLEEPLPPGRLDEYAALRARTGIALAAGEHLYTRWEVKPFLDAGVLDYVQADPDWTGGITELAKICDLAAAHGVPVVPHGHNLQAALHVVASRPPRVCPMIEYLLKHLPRQQFFLREPVEPVNGRVPAPSQPGLGIAFDESKIEQDVPVDW